MKSAMDRKRRAFLLIPAILAASAGVFALKQAEVLGGANEMIQVFIYLAFGAFALLLMIDVAVQAMRGKP